MLEGQGCRLLVHLLKCVETIIATVWTIWFLETTGKGNGDLYKTDTSRSAMSNNIVRCKISWLIHQYQWQLTSWAISFLATWVVFNRKVWIKLEISNNLSFLKDRYYSVQSINSFSSSLISPIHIYLIHLQETIFLMFSERDLVNGRHVFWFD